MAACGQFMLAVSDKMPRRSLHVHRGGWYQFTTVARRAGHPRHQAPYLLLVGDAPVSYIAKALPHNRDDWVRINDQLSDGRVGTQLGAALESASQLC
jgi:hypothetical protein